jgi:hypothetical protein
MDLSIISTYRCNSHCSIAIIWKITHPWPTENQVWQYWKRYPVDSTTWTSPRRADITRGLKDKVDILHPQSAQVGNQHEWTKSSKTWTDYQKISGYQDPVQSGWTGNYIWYDPWREGWVQQESSDYCDSRTEVKTSVGPSPFKMITLEICGTLPILSETSSWTGHLRPAKRISIS